jgi:ubiquinone/menaquinone biosynthesis C-methylase UbiE
MRVVSAEEGYRLWAESFDASRSPIVALESRHLAPWLSDLSGLRVIDVGCGTGRWMKFAAERGARVFGADSTREMLREVARKSGALVEADGRRLPFREACADVVLCTLTIGHMQPIAGALGELARIARPGGRVIVSDFHPEALRRGWKRTFSNAGETCEIETSAYSLDELSCSLLQLEEFRELSFDEPERQLFDDAGKPALFEKARGVPAIWIARFRRRPKT